MDSIAALGFAVGLVAAMVLRWSILNVNFRTGNFARAVLDFSKTMLGWGIVGGLLGLGTGVLIAGAWQRAHMTLRRRRDAAQSDRALTAAAAEPRATTAPNAKPVIAPPATTANIADLRFDASFSGADFVALASRVWPKAYDPGRAASALEHTTNIGAWDGNRLVGAVRVLSDGYFLSTVPEVLVDPAYRNRGIGRELMRRALAAAPSGTLLISATSDSVGFFQRLGCDLAPMGFIMRTRASPQSGPRA